MNLLIPIKSVAFVQTQVESAIPYLMMGANNVVLAHVIEPPLVQTGRYGYSDLTDTWADAEVRHAELVLRGARERIQRICSATNVEIVICHGELCEQLLKLRYEKQIDLIVCARREQRPFWERFCSSFCRKLTGVARCRSITATVAPNRDPGIKFGFGSRDHGALEHV